MSVIRKIKQVFKSKPTMEGAGVHLNRVFGFHELPQFDPFLLLDDFGSDNPDHYIKGFPWHPHRGIETITYVLEGNVEHSDSLGNKGVISSGDVQWMTAGTGIIHQEMPRGDDKGRMYGFQLWANLPSQNKMMGPRYQEITNEQIPEITLPDDTIIKIIAGEVAGIKGPVKDVIIDPEYLDVSVATNSKFRHPTKKGHTIFIYIFKGEGYFNNEQDIFSKGTLLLFEDGDEIVVSTGDQKVRFLLVSGKPLGEPIAWAGPIVMNTNEELEIAFEEYNRGTFIKQ